MPTKINIPMWQQRIQRAEDLQAEKTDERKQILKLYTGTFFGSPLQTNSELTEVNFVYEFMDVMVSSIYARNPFIFVRANSSKRYAFAETMQKVINFYWKQLRAKPKMVRAIIDGVLQPPGFIYIGYHLTTEKNKVFKEIEREFPELKDNSKKEKTEAELGVLDETIKDDDVFMDFVSSWNVLWPDGYHDIRNTPYMFIKQVVPLVDLLANPVYKDSKYDIRKTSQVSHTVQKVKPYTMKSGPLQMFTGYDIDDELIPITLYHTWDKRSKMRFTLVKNFTQDTIFEKEWNYFIDGFPIYPLIFNEIPQTDEKSNSFPLSDIVPMIPQLKELSYLSSAMNRHRKRAGTFMAFKEGTITDTQLSTLQQSHDLDGVILKDLSEQAMKGFTPPSLPQDFYKIRAVILEDLMRVSGYSQLLYNARGIETATESENVRAGALVRQARRVDVIEDFTVMVAQGLAGLIWQFIQDKKRIAEIIGEEVNEEMWPSIPQDETEARRLIQKELFFRIEAGSTQPPKDEAVERKQWENAVGVIKASFPNRIKDDVLLKQWLKKLDFQDIESMIISYDDEEIAVAQEENKLLMQGIPQLVSPNENDILHLQVHSQVYQTPGMNSTPQMDEHLLTHKKNMERKNPTVNPQRGDTKITPQTTTPEISRQGVPENVDFVGAIKNVSGVGGNKGGG